MKLNNYRSSNARFVLLTFNIILLTITAISDKPSDKIMSVILAPLLIMSIYDYLKESSKEKE